MSEADRSIEREDVDAFEETPMKVRLAKSQVFSIRLSDEDLRLIAQAAQRTNVKISVFVRRAALQAARAALDSDAGPMTMSLSTAGVGKFNDRDTIPVTGGTPAAVLAYPSDPANAVA